LFMDEQQEQHQQQNNPYLIPGAIVLAGCMIAVAMMVSGEGAAPATGGTVALEADVLPVTAEDHVLGPRDADVFLIEYSDYRCSFCSKFHSTIMQVLEENEGRVAWVYRHTPYQPGGYEAAVASECIAELAGEEAFWQYTNDALENFRDLNAEWHRAKAIELGADGDEFDACYTSGRHDERIAETTLNSQELGGQGTPFNVLLTRNNGVIKFPGAQPKERVDRFLERAFESL
jgi:protein-disulfide isomerase